MPAMHSTAIAFAVMASLSACQCRISATDDTEETGHQDSPPDDTAHTGDSKPHTGHTGHTGETGDTGTLPPLERICNDDYLTVAELPDPTISPTDPEQLQRVVQVPSDDFEEAYLLVVFHADPEQRLYDDGAPVVVAAIPALKSQDEPISQISPGYGVIEVQPIYSGWAVDGAGTSGVPDASGPNDALMLREAIRFASGQIDTVEGYSIGQVVEAPVCNDKVVVLGASAGGSIAMQALAEMDPVLASGVLGLANHEAPLLPQLILGDAGALWMDPGDLWNNLDENSNGYTYDEGSNPLYRPGDCEGDTCVLDYSMLHWDPDLDPAQIYDWRWAGNTRMGVLYLDLDGDHEVTHWRGDLDVDQNGVLDPDEDFVFVPHWDERYPESLQIYSLELMEAAVNRRVLDEADWPEHITTRADTRAFWQPRNMMTHVNAVVAAAPEWFRVAVDYTVVDHGQSLPDRPHITLFYDAFNDAGVPIRYNYAEAMLDCTIDPALWADDWSGKELPYNYDLQVEELDDHAMGEAINNNVAKALPAVGLLWDMYGRFDRCPLISDGLTVRATAAPSADPRR